MKSISRIFLAALLIKSATCFCQDPIDVTDQTLKIGGLKEEELLFGFAEGDKVVFNFREVDNKELKEIEIVEYPNNSKFSDFKTTRVENKTFKVSKQGVYLFRFKNGNIAGRICKIQIQRIPASSATADFNTSVKWITKQDTTWNTYTKDIIVAYDTTYLQKTKKELVKTEQHEEKLMDKTERVHSHTEYNRADLFFDLPVNEVSEYKTTQVIAWAYWVGVGDEAQEAWNENLKTVGSLAKTAAGYFMSPLGALAVGALANLKIPNHGEDVAYSITDTENAMLFRAGSAYYLKDKGNGTAGYKKFTDRALCQGKYFVCLDNDNMIMAINVNVKVVAIIETNIYEDRPYTEIVVTPRYEKKMFTDPIITEREVLINQ